MIDQKTVREQIAKARRALQRNLAEREALMEMMKGLEGLLRVYDRNGSGPPGTIAPREDRASLRSAVFKVVVDAQGDALHVKEIWRRAQALGATTAGRKAPHNAVDAALHNLRAKGKPVDRAGRGLWRWTGGE